jgi:hypothetical protein
VKLSIDDGALVEIAALKMLVWAPASAAVVDARPRAASGAHARDRRALSPASR